jgi:hypothetical protein
MDEDDFSKINLGLGLKKRLRDAVESLEQASD